MANMKYSREFKIQAVKRIVEDKRSAAQVARELGVNENTVSPVSYRLSLQAA